MTVQPARPKDAIKGGTVTLANVDGAGAGWIFPLASAAYYDQANYQDFMDLMYRPLYMFGGNSNTSVSVNYPLSPARAPVYADGGRTVVIDMKGWRWSDGESVDAEDVIFWLNMDEAEKNNFVGYTPKTLPDNLVSYRATGSDQVTLHLDRAYSSLWFTYNQLAEVTPFPLAWDVTKLGAKPGSGGCTADTSADKWARCAAVYTFLTAQAKLASSYASSALWAVVDGPWKLSSFNENGNYTFVPNPAYSGSPKPMLSVLRFRAYGTESAGYAALKTRAVSVGTVPAVDLPAKSPAQALPRANPLASDGYSLQPAYSFGIGYAYENFNNPVYGPVFRQLYFRQALQELTNQAAIAQAGYGGYGYPTTAGVPDLPRSQFVSAAMQANDGNGPYPFDPAAAAAMLAVHGWYPVRGVLTCQNPGTGARQCGADIARGLQARFTMLVYSLPSPIGQALQSELATAGIQFSALFDDTGLLGPDTTPCHGSECTWTFQYLTGWDFNGPGYEPSGEPLFQTGATWNTGGYTDPQMDSLISQTHTSSSISVFHSYADYTATQLPVLFLPSGYDVVAVSSKLHNVAQNPLGTFLPEYWYLTR